jgi:F420-non-reducing hydrogenase iron-sulfur subunit
MKTREAEDTFEPVIAGFLCNWCSYEAADAAGRSHKEYSVNFRAVRLMCTGRIDPQLIAEAFKDGADGVLILGCHPGDCHYKEGNFKALRRTIFLKKLLAQLGIDEKRLRLEWVSAREAEKFTRIISEMANELKALGPLSLAGGRN